MEWNRKLSFFAIASVCRKIGFCRAGRNEDRQGTCMLFSELPATRHLCTRWPCARTTAVCQECCQSALTACRILTRHHRFPDIFIMVSVLGFSNRVGKSFVLCSSDGTVMFRFLTSHPSNTHPMSFLAVPLGPRWQHYRACMRLLSSGTCCAMLGGSSSQVTEHLTNRNMCSWLLSCVFFSGVVAGCCGFLTLFVDSFGKPSSFLSCAQKFHLLFVSAVGA